jgi:hypothetical protein
MVPFLSFFDNNVFGLFVQRTWRCLLEGEGSDDSDGKGFELLLDLFSSSSFCFCFSRCCSGFGSAGSVGHFFCRPH